MIANRRELLALSGAVLAATAGCLGDDPGSEDLPDPDASDQRVEPDVDPETVEELVRGNTAFAFELYDELSTAEPEADHFVSPCSISMALAMTWAGARGDTAAAMADALSFPLDQDELHPAFNALDRDLEERSEAGGGDDGGDPFELNVANALWPDEGLPLREEFRETMAAHYGARPVELDFDGSPGEASERINDWVAAETEERIDDLVSPGDVAGVELVLTNAIYFLAGWHHEFSEGATSDAEFTALSGTTEEVPMMSQSESFPYAEVDGHQLIELPYVGEETSMVVLLPADGEFEAFEDDLDADRLEELLNALETEHGTIELPRFELETEYSLLGPLGELGLFDGGSDFGDMVEGGGLFVDDVLHDAFVAVDEEGTEAAAATAVAMDDAGPPPAAFEMTVDRPFLFLIRDRPTGAVLFLGRVVDVPEDPQ